MSVAARVFFYVQQVEQLARRRIDQALQGDGITAGPYMALNLLVHREPVSSANLARQSNMTAQSMGEFIKALEAKGLIDRTADATNRRVMNVKSTAAGRKVLVQCEAKVDKIEREFFDCLSGEELAGLRLLLSRVRSKELARMQD